MTDAAPADAISEFEAILAKPGGHENKLQAFLERHTEFMIAPELLNHRLHFRCVISKFPIGDRFCDYAYLTKSSIEWRLVLVELEHANKAIFKDSSPHAAFTASFNDAVAQIETWRDYIQSHPAELRDRLRPLLMPPGMKDNVLNVHYVLVIGRRAELERSAIRRERLAGKRRSDLTVLTYDTIIDDVRDGRGYKKAVLRLGAGGYRLHVAEAMPSHLLSHVTPEHLKLSRSAEAAMRTEGYDIDSWKNGHLLVLNEKWARESAEELFAASPLHPATKAGMQRTRRQRE